MAASHELRRRRDFSNEVKGRVSRRRGGLFRFRVLNREKTKGANGRRSDGDGVVRGVDCGAMNFFNKTHLRRFSVLALLASVLGFAASGCRTMDGAGQDIERAGEKIQENAR